MVGEDLNWDSLMAFGIHVVKVARLMRMEMVYENENSVYIYSCWEAKSLVVEFVS